MDDAIQTWPGCNAELVAAPKRPERPPFGTAPIRCGKTKCKWRGFETELHEVHTARWTQKVCPTCGCDSYSFLTPKEIQAWERNKVPNAK